MKSELAMIDDSSQYVQYNHSEMPACDGVELGSRAKFMPVFAGSPHPVQDGAYQIDCFLVQNMWCKMLGTPERNTRAFRAAAVVLQHTNPSCRDIFTLSIYGQHSINLSAVVFCGLGRSSSFKRDWTSEVLRPQHTVAHIQP